MDNYVAQGLNRTCADLYVQLQFMQYEYDLLHQQSLVDNKTIRRLKGENKKLKQEVNDSML